MIRRAIRFVLILSLVSGCNATPEAEPMPRTNLPKNIIFFIGDGMGSTHFTVLHEIRGSHSTLPRFTDSAMVMTHSASSKVTDSGAAATAMAAGIKTTNAALSVTPDGKAVETALELAEKAGKKTGLVTTTGFWDATPAAFASHTISRGEAELIVEQVLSSGVDLVISNGSERLGTENRPSVEQLADHFGYMPVTDPDDLEKIDGKVLALFPGNELGLDHPQAPLPLLTTYAIEQLSSDPDGFFLVIESEGTDTASHENETHAVLASLRLLDEAVSRGLDFAAANGETLVLFTGDHETGGFQIVLAEGGQGTKLEWYSGNHTGQALPIFAFGPGADRFTGWIDNTDIGKTLKEMVRSKSSASTPKSPPAE